MTVLAADDYAAIAARLAALKGETPKPMPNDDYYKLGTRQQAFGEPVLGSDGGE